MKSKKVIHGLALGLGAAGIAIAALPSFGVPGNIEALAVGAEAVASAILMYVAHDLGVSVSVPGQPAAPAA